MKDIVYRLQEMALRLCGATMEAAHTHRLEWEAANTIEALRAENARLIEERYVEGWNDAIANSEAVTDLRAENARLRDLLDNALGWLDDKEHDEPLLSVDSIRAARHSYGETK